MPDNHSSSVSGLPSMEFLRKQRPVPILSFLTVSLLLFLLCPRSSLADVRVVTATGEHRMTDRETRIDAIRLATEQAKKQALEQVASYLERVTVVRDLDVTQDDIRSYTAGMVLVLDQQVDTALDGDVVVIRVTLKAQVDSEEAAQAILTMKQNEDVRQELVALKEDVDHLHEQLQDANRALARATSPEQTRQLTRQRTDLLDQAESDAMVAQAWTDWVLIAPFAAQPYPSAGVAQVQALLGMAGRLNPNNPHLAIARQTVGTHSPPAPPQPRRPPVPHTVPFLPGYYVVPQQPAESGTTAPADSKQGSNVYQLNPLPPHPSGEPQQSGNSTTIIQVHPRPGSSASVPGRSMMPSYQQIPAPHNQSSHPTLHTYRAGDSLSSPSPQASPDTGTRARPPVIHRTEPFPPSEPAPQRGSSHNHQGEK